MFLRALNESIYWAFLTMIFFFVLDSASPIDFKPGTYTFFGFLFLTGYTFLQVFIFRYGQKVL